MSFGKFFLPGPSEVHPDVLAAMQRPMIPHRGPATKALFAAIQPGLQAIFGTARPVRVGACSATGMMEAGVRLLPRGKVLTLVNGAFSERFARIAEACGHEVERFDVAWGGVHDPDAVAARARGCAGVTVVHSETSTGALQPIAELARAAAAAGAPLLVDSVSGAAGTPLEFDAWGLGFCCTGSQKALALPPGLAFGVASERLLADAQPGSFYLDLRRYDGNRPPFTPALPQLYTLEAQLARIEREGLSARFLRHAAMARRTRESLEVLAPEGFRSPTVTAIPHADARRVVERVAGRGYTIGYGYGKLSDSTFRIGHMGEQTLETLEPLLEICAGAL